MKPVSQLIFLAKSARNLTYLPNYITILTFYYLNILNKPRSIILNI